MLGSTRTARTFVLLILAIGFATRAMAADEDRVRAAFVLNLAKYVEWPADIFDGADAPFVIGVIEDPSFTDVLYSELAKKKVHSRSLEIRLIESSEQARDCQLVYGGHDQRQASRKIALELRGEPVLSVAEYDRFAHVGGMVAFELTQGKVRFEVSRSAADRGGLKVSSKLLRLASAVR